MLLLGGAVDPGAGELAVDEDAFLGLTQGANVPIAHVPLEEQVRVLCPNRYKARRHQYCPNGGQLQAQVRSTSSSHDARYGYVQTTAALICFCVCVFIIFFFFWLWIDGFSSARGHRLLRWLFILQ